MGPQNLDRKGAAPRGRPWWLCVAARWSYSSGGSRSAGIRIGSWVRLSTSEA